MLAPGPGAKWQKTIFFFILVFISSYVRVCMYIYTVFKAREAKKKEEKDTKTKKRERGPRRGRSDDWFEAKKNTCKQKTCSSSFRLLTKYKKYYTLFTKSLEFPIRDKFHEKRGRLIKILALQLSFKQLI